VGNTGAGIAGYWGRADPQLLEVMAGVLQPIPGWDRGAFTSAKLAFTGPRYAIAAGESAIRLPVSEDGNVAVAFDGELYNRDELRSELIERGVALRSTSDGELLLRAFMEYGVDCFTRFNGIWAVGIADLRGGGDRLLLGRDHLGVKPLYLAESDGRVLFSSQISPFYRTLPLVLPQMTSASTNTFTTGQGASRSTHSSLASGTFHRPITRSLTAQEQSSAPIGVPSVRPALAGVIQAAFEWCCVDPLSVAFRKGVQRDPALGRTGTLEPWQRLCARLSLVM